MSREEINFSIQRIEELDDRVDSIVANDLYRMRREIEDLRSLLEEKHGVIRLLRILKRYAASALRRIKK